MEIHSDRIEEIVGGIYLGRQQIAKHSPIRGTDHVENLIAKSSAN